MIDAGDVQKPPTEQRLTPKQTAKTDADLKTLGTLGSYAQSHGFDLILSGGYAVEAHGGGHITRPHGDMDAILFVPTTADRSKITTETQSLLQQEPTPWKLLKEKEGFVEFNENAPEKNGWKEIRRLELYFREKYPEFQPVAKTLIDSNGTVYEVSVEPVEEMVAEKIRTMTNHHKLSDEARRHEGLRELTPTDISDLLRLMTHPEFSRQKYIQAMVGYFDYKSGGKMSREDAIQQAEAKWKAAEEIITS